MYAVIFRAEINTLDESYENFARLLRERAMTLYGCTDFVCTTEGNREIAISYWPDLESITRWKADPEHLKAQALGKSTWYSAYTVQVVEILREQGHRRIIVA